MEILRSRGVKYCVLALFFTVLFISFDINFRGPDEPTYFAYTASLVEKGDLNIVDLFFRSGKYISPTYNVPAPHCYGGVLLWVPFYAYAKAAYFLAERFDITSLVNAGFDRVAKCAMSFSTVVFCCLALFFTYKLLRIFFPDKVAACSILAVFLGTPFFYYVLSRPGNANVVSCLFSVLSLIFAGYMVSMKRFHWFLYGAFFSICVTVKTDLWFQVLFILPLFVTLGVLKKVDWKGGVYFILGFIPILILRVINDYLKYGSFNIEEGRFLHFSNVRNFYFFNGLFSSYRGLFYVSPVYLICLAGFVLIVAGLLRSLKTKDEEKTMRWLFLLILSGYALAKLFLLCNDFPEEDFNGRFLITEFPVFALLFAQVIHARKKSLLYLIAGATVIFVLWNFLLTAETITGLDWVYTAGMPQIWDRIRALACIYPVFCPKDLGLKAGLLIPALPVILLIFLYLTKKFARPVELSFWHKPQKSNFLRGFSLFTIFLCIVFLAITLLNLSNNKRNVEKLKARGFFAQARLMGISEYAQEDFYIPRIELMQYYALKGRLDMYNAIRKYKDRYFTQKDIFGNYSNEAFKRYNVAGVAYRKRSDYNKAIECLHASIRLDPRDIDAYMNLAQIYYALDEEAKAVEELQKIIQLNPGFTHAYIMLGIVYLKTEDYEQAIKAFTEVTRMRPTYADAYSYLGDCYLKQDNFGQAIANYEKAVLSDPTRSWTYSDLAQCYMSSGGDPGKAAEFMEKYFYYYPAEPKFCRSLGEIYVRMGDKKNALKQLKRLKTLKNHDLSAGLERSIRETFKDN